MGVGSGDWFGYFLLCLVKRVVKQSTTACFIRSSGVGFALSTHMTPPVVVYSPFGPVCSNWVTQ